jgi:protein-L-isoaspartate(D-aspartate) O-methyltransferase
MKLSFRGIGMTSQRTRDRLVTRLRAQGIENSTVLAAIQEIPRHIFVDEALASRAYEDSALPIGYGQSISQPYVVARMTEALLDSRAPDRVLEIGTGSGYQAAVLAKVAGKVYTMERVRGLLDQARERLYALGLYNVRLRHADGYSGWPEHAPYDGILVTAAPGGVPAELLAQLAPGGRLVLPVGVQGTQRLMVIRRTEAGYEEQPLEHVSFVPMVGGTS